MEDTPEAFLQTALTPGSSQTSLYSEGHRTGAPNQNLSPHLQTLHVHFLTYGQTDSWIPIFFHLFTVPYYFYFYTQMVQDCTMERPFKLIVFDIHPLIFLLVVLLRFNSHSITFTKCGIQ